MRKNLITVLILAICVINLVLTIIMFFAFLPSASKTNKLIADISEVLDIELASQKSENGGNVNVSDLVPFQLEQGNPINLVSDGSDKSHALQYGLTINLDKTAKDYSQTQKNLEQSTAAVYDMTRDLVGQYTFEQVRDVDVQREIKEKLLASLKEYYGTECIYSINFYNWVAQ
ncbi:MAG: flagellar basal body-associated FliL family protein [Clostridium sp.]|nr:flagellar basal body-associated FliL family protein [Clostridium sp.]MCM1397999.1 flagellar basal body-associated FliL family protein [Clostridium sp.]MCM1459365.1 flagellar basal body-associated FliL family protein [Bacteroides sp.]